MSQFSGWNNQVLEDKQRSGKIRSYKRAPQKKQKNCKKNPAINQTVLQKPSKEKTWLSWNLAFWANEHAVTLSTEYKFHPQRAWRFDWAIQFPSIKLAIEYEGIFSGKGNPNKSGHTAVSGFLSDVEKYNAAQALGWKIIRLTAKNYETVLQQLNEYLK